MNIGRRSTDVSVRLGRRDAVTLIELTRDDVALRTGVMTLHSAT